MGGLGAYLYFLFLTPINNQKVRLSMTSENCQFTQRALENRTGNRDSEIGGGSCFGECGAVTHTHSHDSHNVWTLHKGLAVEERGGEEKNNGKI